MTEHRQMTADPLVLHVIPTPVARGAQREARDLADQLNAPGVRSHRVLSLFDGPDEVRSDVSLHFAGGAVAARGYSIRLVPKLRSALEQLDPVLVVAHGSDPLKYLVPAMFGRRRPLAYYAIGTYAGRSGRPLQLRMWRHLMARADVVAAEGYEVAAECTELLGVPAHRVVMTPNGRDPEVFHPRRSDRDAVPPMVTFVGALTDGKRPDRFIEVVAALRARGLNFRAQLIGGGPLREALIGPALAAGVDLLGPRSDVAELLRQADLMAFPSRHAGEGMPGVLIEAGLSGLPVVATDVPGVSTIVANDETGIVVTEDDLPAMVAAAARLLEDENLRSAMGRAARQRCMDRFSLEAVAGKWLEVLEPLLPATATGGR
jgi:glycosyltransferase involved in cell wall biosynthesis